ncbi:MAG TPA: alkaline phosphatase family protein [Solirubrobacterales bacterium]|nr:alkaline phosphatase family protein [Solirubrobacterales bacterium]
MKLIREPLEKAIAAAATLNGKSLALLIASSLVATSGIVAAGANSSGGLNPTEVAAASALLEEETQVASAPAPAAPESSPSPSSSPEGGAGPVVGGGGTCAGCSVPPPPTPPAEEASPADEKTPVVPTAEPEAEAGPVQHVFLVSLASPGYEASFGATSQMPYLSGELRPQGVLLSEYTLLDTTPLPNGIAAVSGQPPTAETKADCPRYEECVHEVETLTLADQLVGARLRWHGYFEGMANEEGQPDSCVRPEPEAAVTPNASGYSARLNPFVFFHSLLDLGDCDENAVPLTELAGDLKKVDSTANFSYVSPNLCNAGFRGTCAAGTPEGAAAADASLAKVVPEILSSPAYKKDGLLIVTFGAADPAPPPDPAVAPAADPRKVGALILSPLLSPGATDATPYNPYSLLRTTEDLFDLSPLGNAAGKKVRSFASAFTAGNGGD